MWDMNIVLPANFIYNIELNFCCNNLEGNANDNEALSSVHFSQR